MTRKPHHPMQGRFIDVDGIRLYHRVCEQAGPEAPAVVHVHGFGVSGHYLEPTAVRLTDRANHYIPDLPGTGASQHPAQGLDIPGLMRWLLAYCDAVGLEKPTFVGNSLGCVTLIELADTHPDRVESLVFVSPAGGPNNQPLVKALGQMAIDGLLEPLSMARVAVRDYLRFGLVRGFSLFRAMSRYPTIARLALLERPVLVIAGRQDPLLDKSRINTLFEGREGMSAAVIDGAHALNFTHPENVAALIAAHMDGTPLGDVTPSSGSIDVLFEAL